MKECKKCKKDFKSPEKEQQYCCRQCYIDDKDKFVNRGENHYAYIKEDSSFLIKDEIDAYFIGFIQTDGSISYKNIGIEIQKKDKDLLLIFQKRYGGRLSFRTRNTNYKENATSVLLNISNRRMVLQLNNLGIPIGKKSSILSPIKIPEKLERHYVRGLIDGDGTLCVYKGKAHIGFVTQSDNMKNYFCDYCFKNINHKFNIHRNTRDNIFNINLNGPKAIKLIKLLYNNAIISLKRKQIIADSL